MIFITGDTHIPVDIRKLNTSNFPYQKEMTKKDYVIICGDFGGVWSGSDEEEYWLDWLEQKNFTTLFLDGNHENFDMLNSFPETTWKGGKVHIIRDSVMHLMRGQKYKICGQFFFTMGGGTSIDWENRVEGLSWWPQEVPSQEEIDQARSNLERFNWRVDYVLTHTASLKRMKEMAYQKENSRLNRFFDVLEEKLSYKHWYFGHFHEDFAFPDGKHTAVYNKFIRINKDLAFELVENMHEGGGIEHFYMHKGNFLDDFYRLEDKRFVLAKEPQRYDEIPQRIYAFIAGMVEHLSNDYSLDVPGWVNKDFYFLKSPYWGEEFGKRPSFASGKLGKYLFENSPDAFRKRNVFTDESTLMRA